MFLWCQDVNMSHFVMEQAIRFSTTSASWTHSLVIILHAQATLISCTPQNLAEYEAVTVTRQSKQNSNPQGQVSSRTIQTKRPH